ncbi:MAG: carboxymuconolactone decarboxylase family protein [Sphingomonadales bacterium]
MTDAPRLPLVDPGTAPEEIRGILEAWPLGLHRTIAHNPETLSRWMVFAEHILRGNSLPERDREIVILRVAWNTRSRYEWGMHGRLARRIGMTDADLGAIVEGPETASLPVHERALIRAVDEIQQDWKITDATWHELAARYTPAQLIDLIFVTGQFMLVAVTLNSLNIPMEQQEGLEPFPAPR